MAARWQVNPVALGARVKVIDQFGLGIDAGGTATRWAVVDGMRELISQGSVEGLTGLMMMTEHGQAFVRTTLLQLTEQLAQRAPQVHRLNAITPLSIYAGFTGLGTATEPLQALIRQSLTPTPARVRLVSDIELAFRTVFKPGEGHIVYAGTGSIAAHIDAAGTLHRAGGRGALLDDGGGGYWVAREAMRAVWRAEDERPGAWKKSPLAAALFEKIGGKRWDDSREFFYSKSRGEIGTLARAVARAAIESKDPIALDILARAGDELARLANAMCTRYGAMPVALAGGAIKLHPIIEAQVRAQLPAEVPLSRAEHFAHHTAALLALEISPQ